MRKGRLIDSKVERKRWDCSGEENRFICLSRMRRGFYRHFASKDELVAEAFQLALDHLFEMIERETTDKSAAKATKYSDQYLFESVRGRREHVALSFGDVGL